MKKVFQIFEGKVINITVQPENFEPDGIFWVADDGIHGIGDSFVDGEFIRNEVETLPTSPETISDLQFFQQLALSEKITQEEAISAVSVGKLPQELEEFIASQDLSEEFSLRIFFSGTREFKRSSPEIVSLFEFMDLKLEDFWLEASKK